MALVPIDPNNGLYIFDNDAIAPRYPLYNSEEIINQLHANWPSHNLTESNNLVFDIPGIAVQHVDAIFCTNERHMLFAPQFLRVNENGNGYDWVNNLSDHVFFKKFNLSLTMKGPSSDWYQYMSEDNAPDLHIWMVMMKELNCLLNVRATLVAVDSAHYLRTLPEMKLLGHARILTQKVFHPRDIVELELKDFILPADQYIVLLLDFNWNSHVLAYYEQFSYPEYYSSYVRKIFVNYNYFANASILHSADMETLEETN